MTKKWRATYKGMSLGLYFNKEDANEAVQTYKAKTKDIYKLTFYDIITKKIQ